MPKTIDFGYDGIGDITQIYRMNYVGMGPNQQTDPADSAISYNPLGQLTAITPSHNGVNIDPLSWTYDTLGQPDTFTDSDGTATYGYNLDSELTRNGNGKGMEMGAFYFGCNSHSAITQLSHIVLLAHFQCGAS